MSSVDNPSQNINNQTPNDSNNTGLINPNNIDYSIIKNYFPNQSFPMQNFQVPTSSNNFTQNQQNYQTPSNGTNKINFLI